MTLRLDDPPFVIEDVAEPAYDGATLYQSALDQARVVVTFLRELEACGLPHDEALWLTAQFWRYQ